MKVIVKGKLKEGAVDLMLSNEEKILANSRLAVCNTLFIPMIMGCVILSGVYLSTMVDLLNLIFGWVWFGLALFTYCRYKKAKKKILEMTE